jgi:hypothetical protein
MNNYQEIIKERWKSFVYRLALNGNDARRRRRRRRYTGFDLMHWPMVITEHNFDVLNSKVVYK